MQTLGSFGHAVLKYGFFTFLALCGYKSVLAVAGTDTSFRAVVDAAFKLEINKYAGYAIAGVFGLTAHRERRLRKREVKELSAQVKKLEAVIDPSRSTSGLTEEGVPQPEVQPS